MNGLSSFSRPLCIKCIYFPPSHLKGNDILCALAPGEFAPPRQTGILVPGSLPLFICAFYVTVCCTCSFGFSVTAYVEMLPKELYDLEESGFLLFGKWSHDVECKDVSLKDYIAVKEILVPHSAGRNSQRRFKKAEVLY